MTIGSLVVAWFATTPIRASQAENLDAAVRDFLSGNDLDAAYRNAQFADAIKPTDERHMTRGAVAYVRTDYSSALASFETIDESRASERVAIGVAASAGQLGDREAYTKAVNRAGKPSGQVLLTALAHANLNAGDLQGLNRLTKDTPSFANEFAVAKSIGLAIDEPTKAKAALELEPSKCPCVTDNGSLRVEADSDPYGAFLRKLITTERGSRQDLSQTYDRMAQTTNKPTRLVYLSEQLYRLGKFRAAEATARDAIQQANNYRDGYNALAAAQLALGDEKAAARSLKTSLDLDKGSGYTWYLRAKVAAAEGDENAAREYQEQADALGYTAD